MSTENHSINHYHFIGYSAKHPITISKYKS
jgi:hypothetical protein